MKSNKLTKQMIQEEYSGNPIALLLAVIIGYIAVIAGGTWLMLSLINFLWEKFAK